MGSNPATPTIHLIEIANKKARLSSGSLCLKREHNGSKRTHRNIKSRKSPAACFYYVRVRGHAVKAQTDSNRGYLCDSIIAGAVKSNHLPDAPEPLITSGRSL